MGTELFLSMLQLSDSFFPTGAYAMSNGLEVIAKKRRINAKELRRLLQSYIEQQIGPADCCALSCAFDCAKKAEIAGIIEADDALFSLKLVAEARSASARSGTQLVRTVCEFAKGAALAGYAKAINDGKASGIYPVALAVACEALEIPKQNAAAMLLYSFCVSMAGAALRLGAIDHVEAQKVLHGLKPAIGEAARNAERPLGAMWQFAPAIDIAQMEHGRMDSKMFIT
jgi:urease accessory protein